MNANWLFAVIVASSVGSGIFIYGIRQREFLSAMFGLTISSIPYVIHTGWLNWFALITLVATYWFLKRRY